MPENQNPELQQDLLEQLLAGAAERETKKAMDELAQKGTVTKAEFSTALNEFGRQLTDTITTQVKEIVQKAAPAAEEETEDKTEETDPIKKGGSPSHRKGTVNTSPREENPLRYIVQKARSKEELDPTDKALVWGLTLNALAKGMTYYNEEIEDFGDDNL